MNLAEYIKDSERAVAKEIFNAKFNSVEDVIALEVKIKKEKQKFYRETFNFNYAILNVRYARKDIAECEKQLETCHTEDDIKEIKRKLECLTGSLKQYERYRDKLFKKYDAPTLAALSKNFKKKCQPLIIKSKQAF